MPVAGYSLVNSVQKRDCSLDTGRSATKLAACLVNDQPACIVWIDRDLAIESHALCDCIANCTSIRIGAIDDLL
jgi:hypothetical protein